MWFLMRCVVWGFIGSMYNGCRMFYSYFLGMLIFWWVKFLYIFIVCVRCKFFVLIFCCVLNVLCFYVVIVVNYGYLFLNYFFVEMCKNIGVFF